MEWNHLQFIFSFAGVKIKYTHYRYISITYFFHLATGLYFAQLDQTKREWTIKIFLHEQLTASHSVHSLWTLCSCCCCWVRRWTALMWLRSVLAFTNCLGQAGHLYLSSASCFILWRASLYRPGTTVLQCGHGMFNSWAKYSGVTTIKSPVS